MRLLWLIPFIIVLSVAHGDMLHFRKKLLDTFNDARSMIASGQLQPLIDVVNKMPNVTIPHFGPAANMHKLKWSRHLEQHAFLYSEKNGFHARYVFRAFENNGLVGFTWSGEVLELAKNVFDFLPLGKIEKVLKAMLDIIDFLITALLLLYSYPGEKIVADITTLGATNSLFAHRYEIGCYGKMFYTICMMENGSNGGRLYQKGIPCSNCSTGYCEFDEDENGYIEEGNLCEPPKESIADNVNTFAPRSSTIPINYPEKKFWKSNFLFSTSSILFSLTILITIFLVHVFSK